MVPVSRELASAYAVYAVELTRLEECNQISVFAPCSQLVRGHMNAQEAYA